MPERETIYQQLATINGSIGSLEAKIDGLISSLKDHIQEDRALEKRVRNLEIGNAKIIAVASVIAAIISLLASKVLALMKF
jgi:hypothetical protein